MNLKKEIKEGDVFGRLTVQYFAFIHENKKYWCCKCECRNLTWVHTNSLNKGNTKSCGCLKKEKIKEGAIKHHTKHGNARSRSKKTKPTKTYSIWCAMKARCNNPNHKGYKDYGGRGIKVNDEWMHSFKRFLTDMGECPENYSIERINVNGDYELSNCIWIPLKEQAKNRRRAKK